MSGKQEFKKQSYLRLLKYAAPYKFRLLIGILAGLLVGGSLFGSFMMIPQLMQAIAPSNDAADSAGKKADTIVAIYKEEKDTSKEQKLRAIKATLSDSKTKPAQILEILEKPELKEAALKEEIKDCILKPEEDKIAEKVKEAKSWAADYLHIDLPIRYEVGRLYFESSLLTFNIPAERPDGKMTWQFFSIFVVGFIFMWFLKNLGTYINRYFTRWVGTKVVADLRDEVFKKLMDQSLKFYGKSDIGQLISRCTNDTAAIESAVANTIADATRCPLEILASVSFIVIAAAEFESYSLPIILFIGLPICVLPIVLIGRRVRKIYRKAFAKIAVVVSRMHEVFTSVIVIKAYHTEEKETSVFKDINRKYFRTVVKALKTELLMAPAMEVVAVAATLVFLVYSYSQGVTLTNLAMLLVPAVMAYRPIKQLAKVTTYLQRSMAAADRYFDLIDTDTSIPEKDDPVIIDNFEKEISFNDVVFSFEKDTNILDGVSFKIPKGHMVAVVGETGSGKTTIANLIARFYDVNSGNVAIDGHDVKNLKISSLRDLIGIINQDPIIFNDTIAHNIAYGCENVSQEQIENAAKQANAHEFIMDGRHPEGYNTIAGEKGFNLSGGEKQRISIARAIVKNPPILILDEATSALDTVTERLVQDALNHLMEERTVFAIAHRLSTIKHANMIIVLDKGKIVESGTHDELLTKNGRYRKLHDTQFGIKE